MYTNSAVLVIVVRRLILLPFLELCFIVGIVLILVSITIQIVYFLNIKKAESAGIGKSSVPSI